MSSENPPGRDFYEDRIMDVFGVGAEDAADIFDWVRDEVEHWPTLEDIADLTDDIFEAFGIVDIDYGDFDDEWLDYGDEIEESASAYGDDE